MLNRMHNIKNNNQGPEEKLLFLCSAGLLRSPTAAALFWNKGYNTRAAGVETDYALIPVDEVLLAWADKVIVMEAWQAKRLNNMFEDLDTDKLYVLNIADAYPRNSDRLLEILEQRAGNLEDYKYELLQEESPTQTEEG